MLPNPEPQPETDAPASGDQNSDFDGAQTPGIDGIPMRDLPSLSDGNYPLTVDPMGFAFQCWGGITISGGFYAIFAITVGAAWVIVASPFRSVLQMILAIAGAVVAGAVVGVLFAGVAGALCVALVWAVNRSLGNVIPGRIRGISAAGLTGFAGLCVAILVDTEDTELAEIVVMMLAGPVLATVVMSLFVGLYIDRYCIYYDGIANSTPRFRINIRHLLVVTVWGAIVLSFANFVGMIEISVLAFGWLILQVFAVALESLFKKFRVWRQKKSTKIRMIDPLDATTNIVISEHSKTDPMF